MIPILSLQALESMKVIGDFKLSYLLNNQTEQKSRFKPGLETSEDRRQNLNRKIEQYLGIKNSKGKLGCNVVFGSSACLYV